MNPAHKKFIRKLIASNAASALARKMTPVQRKARAKKARAAQLKAKRTT
jgi:hypothetical protein